MAYPAKPTVEELTNVETGPIPPPLDDEAKLAQKKKELDALKSEIDAKTDLLNNQSAALKLLELRVADVQKASGSYQEASKQLEKDLAEDRKILATKLSMAEAGIGDQKNAIDKKIQAVHDGLMDQAKQVEALGEKAESAQQAYAVAAKDAATKQATYADIKNTQKNLEATLKNAKSLLDQALTAETQGNVFAMYFLLKEASPVVDMTIPSPGDIEAKLKAAQADAETAKDTAAAKKADSDKKTQEYQDAQKNLQKATAGRQADVLTQLEQFNKEAKPTSGVAAKAP